MSYSKLIQNEEFQDEVDGYVAFLVNVCYNLAVEAGWNEPGKVLTDKHEINTALVLIHSEVSEAAEGVRKDTMDDKLPHRPQVEVELADALIRILNLAGHMNLDVAGAVAEKLAYNVTRKDHQLEARNSAGGKSY